MLILMLLDNIHVYLLSKDDKQRECHLAHALRAHFVNSRRMRNIHFVSYLNPE